MASLKVIFAAAVLSLGASAVVAQDLPITIENGTKYDIYVLQTSPSDVNEWEDDVLGEDVLAAGEILDLLIADGREQCSYDVRVIFEDEVEITGAADFCATSDFIITRD